MSPLPLLGQTEDTWSRQKILGAYKYDLSIGVSRWAIRIRDCRAEGAGDQERRGGRASTPSGVAQVRHAQVTHLQAWTGFWLTVHSFQRPRWTFLLPRRLPLDETPESQERTSGRSEPAGSPFLQVSGTPGRTGLIPFLGSDNCGVLLSCNSNRYSRPEDHVSPEPHCRSRGQGASQAYTGLSGA